MSAETQVQPTVETPPETPPVEPTAPETPPAAAAETALPGKFEFGDDERATTRQIHAEVRELQRIQTILEARKAEVASLDEQLAKVGRVPSGPGAEADEDGLVDFRGARLPKETTEYLQALESMGGNVQQALRQINARLDGFQNADIEAEQQERQNTIETHLRALAGKARQGVLPGLPERSGKRADREVFGEFENRMNAFAEAHPDDPAALTDDELQKMLVDAAQAVCEDYTAAGWAQLKVNKTAAALQPPALGGTPAEPGPKDYEKMTPEEQEKAWREQNPLGKLLEFR